MVYCVQVAHPYYLSFFVWVVRRTRFQFVLTNLFSGFVNKGRYTLSGPFSGTPLKICITYNEITYLSICSIPRRFFFVTVLTAIDTFIVPIFPLPLPSHFGILLYSSYEYSLSYFVAVVISVLWWAERLNIFHERLYSVSNVDCTLEKQIRSWSK